MITMEFIVIGVGYSKFVFGIYLLMKRISIMQSESYEKEAFRNIYCMSINQNLDIIISVLFFGFDY